ncbi:MAG TPA: dihydroorotate dehydrogenase electron transfer subunit [Bacteroidales bacterium]|nr:dihydroorotate dehydrogenase electron transfer subunit [Bacteroidales bacterium]HSA43305.1 dihydroorotate dehydrogenase electron transfer subunit [Bacteroidales bacterium]
MSKAIHDLVLRENVQLSPFYHRLDFTAPSPLPECEPGQFAELLVPPGPGVFLRRPFSIHAVDYKDNTISFLIKLVGEGTRRLAGILPGTVINTVYPLGRGFTMPEKGPVLLVGGGCGIAPLLFLSARLKAGGFRTDCLLGGRTEKDIIETADFERNGAVFITTEDGSLGEKGLVTAHSLFDRPLPYTMVYACGPEAMLRAVAMLAMKASVPCEVSLENTMACGVGVCLCCVVPTTEGNQCVCTEGPVFNINRLSGWDQAARIADSCPVI